MISTFRKLLKCRGKRLSARLEIKFLKECLEEAVAPRWLRRRVIKSKVSYSHKMEKAFLADVINAKEEHLRFLRTEQEGIWCNLVNMLKSADRIRMSAYISKTERRKEERDNIKHYEHLQRLKKERFGNTCGQYSNIFNLAELELTDLEKEVLSRGLKFGIPRKTSREEVWAKFEVLHQQLGPHKPTSEEAADSCRI